MGQKLTSEDEEEVERELAEILAEVTLLHVFFSLSLSFLLILFFDFEQQAGGATAAIPSVPKHEPKVAAAEEEESEEGKSEKKNKKKKKIKKKLPFFLNDISHLEPEAAPKGKERQMVAA